MKQPLLIIDDDEEIRTQMKWALAADYEVSLAEDRNTALDLFRTTRPAPSGRARMIFSASRC